MGNGKILSRGLLVVGLVATLWLTGWRRRNPPTRIRGGSLAARPVDDAAGKGANRDNRGPPSREPPNNSRRQARCLSPGRR